VAVALTGCSGGGSTNRPGSAQAGATGGTTGGTTGNLTGGATGNVTGGTTGNVTGGTTGNATGGTTGNATGGTTGNTTTGGTSGATIQPLPLPSGPVGSPRAHGADVSKYEGTVDWQQASTTGGLSFAIARVSDGLHYPDATFAPNWSGMKAHGMVRGVYQFFRASQDPIAQADYLVAQIGSIGPGDMPPFADVETLDSTGATQATANLRAWFNEVQTKLGVTPAIYTSARVWTMFGNPTGFSQYDLWPAEWPGGGITGNTGDPTSAVPSEWRTWNFWQYTDAATVAGINGSPGVDGDVFHGTVDDLHAYAGLPVPNGFFRGVAADSTGKGYWTCVYDGGVFAYGDATFRGTAGGQSLPAPVLGIVRTPTGLGYWLFGADGSIYPYGDAVQAGNLAGRTLAAPIVGMAATPTGQGYFLLGQDGSIFAFGDAQGQGTPGAQLTGAAVAIASTPTGKGYWIASADGNVYAFGDAPPKGSSLGGLSLPVTGIAGTPSGQGYWLVEADGAVQSFGDAPILSYTGAIPQHGPIVGLAATLSGQGYWLVTDDGIIFPLGDAVNGATRPR
jgi:GH25 family lysozyme M1 (1,4-beta-N-acetylmuramidase)